MGIIKNKVFQITVFIVLVITSLLLISFCGANQGSKTRESIYEYNGLTYTIVTNNAFYDIVDIKITEVAINNVLKNELAEKLPGIKFTDPNVIKYSSGIRPTTGSFDKEQLTQKAIDKLKELKLYPEYEVMIWSYVSVEEQILSSNSVLSSDFNITDLIMHLRPAYRGIPLIKEYRDINFITLTGNGEIYDLSFYNNDVRISSKHGKLTLLPIEEIIKNFDESAQNTFSYQTGLIKELRCIPIYFFNKEKYMPAWCIGNGHDLTNPSYVNAVTGEVIMIGFK